MPFTGQNTHFAPQAQYQGDGRQAQPQYARARPEPSQQPSHAQQQQQQQNPPPPQWISELMDAAESGDNEFRKEVRKVILEQKRGNELVQILEDIVKNTEDEAQKKEAQDMLTNVKKWIADPSELEEGGRFLGFGHGRFFSRLMHGYGRHGGYGRYGYGGYGGGYGSSYGYPAYGGYGGGYYGGYAPTYASTYAPTYYGGYGGSYYGGAAPIYI